MIRRETWRVDFFAAIEAHRGHRFAWGQHDCAILTADCILAVTGLDLAAPYRGRYSDAEGSIRVLAEVGHSNAVAVLAGAFVEIHPSRAMVGDAAIIRTERGPATAPIVGGELVAYTPAGDLGLASLAEAVRAFRVEIRGGE